MSYTLCEKVRNLSPYEPILGEYKIRLDANESFLSLSPSIREKIGRIAAQLDFKRYPDPYASALCAQYASVYGISPDNLTVGDGSDELISIINNCLLQKEDTILAASDDFSMYAFYGALSEHPILIQQKNQNFQLDIDESIRIIKEKNVRMMIFSNPCNPTGQGLPREQVRRLIMETDALIVLDEAYMDFWDQSLLEEVNQYDNLIILKTCSKAIGLASLRIGFAVANRTLTRALRAVKSPYNVGMLPQAIAAAVLSEPDYLSSCIAALIQSREQLEIGIKTLSFQYPQILEKVYDSVTNFVFIKTPFAAEIQTALQRRSIAIRCFKGFLRISAGSPQENQEVLQALAEVLEKEVRI